jgi:eukaryotic-like serine/threonine-protein kinase
MRQTGLMAAGWVAAAVLATATGVAGVAVIGRGLSGPSGELMSAEEIDRALAGAPTTTPPTPRPALPSPSASASASASTDAVRRTPGGTVTARCEGPEAVIVSWAPANGYAFRELDRRRGVEAEMSFEHGDERVKVEVTCPAGKPVFAVEVRDG